MHPDRDRPELLHERTDKMSIFRWFAGYPNRQEKRDAYQLGYTHGLRNIKPIASHLSELADFYTTGHQHGSEDRQDDELLRAAQERLTGNQTSSSEAQPTPRATCLCECHRTRTAEGARPRQRGQDQSGAEPGSL